MAALPSADFNEIGDRLRLRTPGLELLIIDRADGGVSIEALPRDVATRLVAEPVVSLVEDGFGVEIATPTRAEAGVR
jgi:hypothetical protein